MIAANANAAKIVNAVNVVMRAVMDLVIVVRLFAMEQELVARYAAVVARPNAAILSQLAVVSANVVNAVIASSLKFSALFGRDLWYIV